MEAGEAGPAVLMANAGRFDLEELSSMKGPIDFVPSQELYPFESRWFESSVGSMHYIDEGEGPAILFLHGNPMWSFLYRKIVRILRDDFRCIAVDYPGFGLSVRPPGYGYLPRDHAVVVGELVEELDLQDAILMGQDWGGPIGLQVAAEAPDRFRGLVMGNTWYWPAEGLTMNGFRMLMSAAPIQWLIREKNLFVERGVPMGMNTKLTAEEMEHYRRVQPAGLREGVAVFPKAIRGTKRWMAGLGERVRERMADKPLLLTWGMQDFAFKPGATIPRWRRDFPQAQLVELRGAKHYIQEDAPEEIAAAIRERYG